ncbi:riboflavin biosynthesis protein RibF [Ruminococcaceae bacterium OttesenSCG-928-I18]|nr:riboflavin biosynthesis protein RibF [Ruminococcaceae bacterium OttesenSCG-928-I18]
MRLIEQGGIGNGEPGTALALGYFDGIHIGHAKVIETAGKYAKAHGLHLAVFTFERADGAEGKARRLLTPKQKHAVLESLGVEFCFEPSFSSFRDLSPRMFFTEKVLKEYAAKSLFCGENFGFGARRAGNTQTLKEFCAEFGLQLSVLPLAMWEGEPVSSSRIRNALAEGEIEAVNAMLGRPYEILFPVERGKGFGHRHGFPTINQKYPESMQAPRYGVYITSTFVGGEWRPSATGYGTRPTVQGQDASCETFIPSYEGDLYGQEVAVRFYKRIAQVSKFSSAQELASAVQRWARQAETFFSS